ncbi:MAG: hypothetical protein PW843_07250 [Azospirillaceae bacterium]|nr:hypothetical protein [Azospirillaceae bacterium]
MEDQRQKLVEEWGVEVSGKGLKPEPVLDADGLPTEAPDPLAEAVDPDTPPAA